MGKLNIAHHKSYHPYRRDNIERVRKDEAEAAAKEAKEEGRMMLADSEARIEQLRERLGVAKKKKAGKNDDMKELDATLANGQGSSSSDNNLGSLSEGSGHINLFGDLEQNAVTLAAKATKTAAATAAAESEKGVALAPSAKDLKPWYVEKTAERHVEPTEEDTKAVQRRQRDSFRKTLNDPLTSITKQLASSSSSSGSRHTMRRPHAPKSTDNEPHDPQQARLSRESSERARAQALIRRKQVERLQRERGSMTPSTVHGDDESEYGYTDMYNRKEVAEAHRGRDHRRDRKHRGWDGDRRTVYA